MLRAFFDELDRNGEFQLDAALPRSFIDDPHYEAVQIRGRNGRT